MRIIRRFNIDSEFQREGLFELIQLTRPDSMIRMKEIGKKISPFHYCYELINDYIGKYYQKINSYLYANGNRPVLENMDLSELSECVNLANRINTYDAAIASMAPKNRGKLSQKTLSQREITEHIASMFGNKSIGGKIRRNKSKRRRTRRRR